MGNGKDVILRRIVLTEWDMFQQVKGIDGRADCQDDFETFVIMRSSQFDSWEENVLASYLFDLEEAKAAERNLIMEKYAYMMAETDPAYFNQIKHLLPPVSEEVLFLAERITNYYLKWEQEVEARYPRVRMQGRPAEDLGTGPVSIHNYLRSELMTYSQKTLMLLLASIEAKPELNRYKDSLNRMAKAYGYRNLDDAEYELSKQMG